MKLTKYEEYKCSHEWLGYIPQHWSLDRIKNIFDQISIKSKKLKEGTYIPLENIQSFTGKLLVECSNENDEETILFKKGDLLFMKLRPYLGKVLMAEFDGGVSGEIIVNRINNLKRGNNYNRYFFYRLLSSQFIFKVNSLTDGVKMPRANPSKVCTLNVAIPSFQEQQSIANFLDQKTTSIDQKISLLQSKIAYCKELSKSLINEAVCGRLNIEQEIKNHSNPKNQKNHSSDKIKITTKESGIEWIGKIPEHWEVKRLKDVLNKNDGGIWGEFSDDGIIVLRSTEINLDGSWSIENPAKIVLTEKEIKSSKLIEGDLLITKSSGSDIHIGKTALVSKEIEQLICCYSNFMQRIRPQRNNSSSYFFWFLNSNLARFQYNVLSKSTTGLGNLSSELINLLSFPVPPSLEEQTAIATYLNEKIQKIDNIVTNINKQIERLKELRKTLINDVITGKLKVTP